MVCDQNKEKISVQLPNSVSDDFSNFPTRRRRGITASPFDSAVERSILDIVKQSVSLNTPPCLRCFFLLTQECYVVQIPLSLFFFLTFFLPYCCTAVVVLPCTHMGSSWVVVVRWVFPLCTVLYFCTIRCTW